MSTGLLGPADVEILDKRVLCESYFKFESYRFRHRLFDGNWSDEMEREVLDQGDCVSLLPYDPVRDQVVMVEEFRLPALLAGSRPWQLQFVGGIIEPGQSAVEAGLLETKEETGLDVLETEFICRYIPTFGSCKETIALYVGRVSIESEHGLAGLAGQSEDIRFKTVPIDDALRCLRNGEIEHSAAVIALLWLQIERERLRQKWS